MAAARKGRGKSGLHGLTVPDNVRRGRPQGKCHRKQTTASPEAARVKRCGKSAPREQQCERHGKPHREQDRIGTTCMATCRAFPACRPGWLPEAAGNGRPRGMAITPHPARAAALQNPAYRPTGGSAGGWCQSAELPVRRFGAPRCPCAHSWCVGQGGLEVRAPAGARPGTDYILSGSNVGTSAGGWGGNRAAIRRCGINPRNSLWLLACST